MSRGARGPRVTACLARHAVGVGVALVNDSTTTKVTSLLVHMDLSLLTLLYNFYYNISNKLKTHPDVVVIVISFVFFVFVVLLSLLLLIIIIVFILFFCCSCCRCQCHNYCCCCYYYCYCPFGKHHPLLTLLQEPV